MFLKMPPFSFSWLNIAGLCILILVATTLPAFAANKLTLKQAIDAALQNSPEVGIARERERQYQEGINQAKGGLLPQVNSTLEVSREYNNPAGGREKNQPPGAYSTSKDITFEVKQHIFDGDQTEAEIRKRKEFFRGAQFKQDAVKQKISLQMIETFLGLDRNIQSLAIVDLFVARLQGLSTKMDLYAKEGNASKTLQKYVSSRLANAQQLRVQIKNALQEDIEQYSFLTNQNIDISNTIIVLQDLPHLRSYDDYLNLTRTNNPQLKSDLADLAAAKEDVKKAKSEYYPDVNLNAEYESSWDSGGDVGQIRSAAVTMQMKYNIFDGFSREANIQNMLSITKERELQVQRTQRRNEKDLNTAWQELQAKIQEAELNQKEFNDSVDVRNLREQEFEEGEGNLMDLVEAEEKLFAAARQKLQIQSQILLNRYVLEYLTGAPQIDSVSLADNAQSLSPVATYSQLMSTAQASTTVPLPLQSAQGASSVSSTLIPDAVPVQKPLVSQSPIPPISAPSSYQPNQLFDDIWWMDDNFTENSTSLAKQAATPVPVSSSSQPATPTNLFDDVWWFDPAFNPMPVQTNLASPKPNTQPNALSAPQNPLKPVSQAFPTPNLVSPHTYTDDMFWPDTLWDTLWLNSPVDSVNKQSDLPNLSTNHVQNVSKNDPMEDILIQMVTQIEPAAGNNHPQLLPPLPAKPYKGQPVCGFYTTNPPEDCFFITPPKNKKGYIYLGEPR